MGTKLLACALAGLLPLAGAGCYGSFNLTRKVYRFNRTASPDRWVREIVFLALVIVPIYEIATLLDALVLNSLEFWTGRNPVLARDGDTQTLVTADGRATLTRRSADVLEVQLRTAAGAERSFLLVHESDAIAARELDGALIARAAEPGGVWRQLETQRGGASAARTSSALAR